jgi:maleylpyruvate isomerase
MNDRTIDMAEALMLCTNAHERLLRSCRRLSDDQVQGATLLPGWTKGHLITHLARNADAHARRVEGALLGRDVPKYAGGSRQRRDEIEAGAHRPAMVLCDDLEASQRRLERAFSSADAAGWPNAGFRGAGSYEVVEIPMHRIREVEMHHVDLDTGYEVADWPERYVAWELSILLASVPGRLASIGDMRRMVAWLSGRVASLESSVLAPWG